MFNNLSNQQRGSLLAFVGVMFITPDSLFICQGDTVIINAPSGFAQYNWSTGATTSSISTTLTGNYKNNKELLKKINLLCMEEATIIHKESEDVFFSVICKNQTCSEKLKSFDEITNFFFELKNVQ